MSVNFQCIVLELVPLRGKKLFRPRPGNRILVPFRGSFQYFRLSPPSLSYGSSPRGLNTLIWDCYVTYSYPPGQGTIEFFGGARLKYRIFFCVWHPLNRDSLDSTERTLYGFMLFKPEKGNYRPNPLRLTKVYVFP